jgi:coenzyme F420-reducing hydrogenase gamma subunit
MAKARIAVHKFSSCDGCQLQFLTLEEELLQMADRVEIAYFIEASSDLGDGPFGKYDVSFVEGSVSTPEEEHRIKQIRENSKVVFAIGACGTAGGIQALRNWGDLDSYKNSFYTMPQYVEASAKSTPFSDHIKVDGELAGCPPDQMQLKYVVNSILSGVQARIPTEAICLKCKRDGNVCVLVASEIPCMGPVTKTGCGALCPHQERDCYSCFGPADTANIDALGRRFLGTGMPPNGVVHRLRFIYSWAPKYREASERWITDGSHFTPLPSPPGEQP